MKTSFYGTANTALVSTVPIMHSLKIATVLSSYEKIRDGKAIAKQMNESQIPEEVANEIEEIRELV